VKGLVFLIMEIRYSIKVTNQIPVHEKILCPFGSYIGVCI
jgi:hypothetical protein